MERVNPLLQEGDLVISWDFEPIPGRDMRFVIGHITLVDLREGLYVIQCEFDSTDMERVGSSVFAPVQMLITDWAGRVRKLEG